MESARQPGYCRIHDGTIDMQGIWWHHSHARYIMTSQPHRACDDVTAMQDTWWCHSHTGHVMAKQPCRIQDDITVIPLLISWTLISWTQHSQIEMNALIYRMLQLASAVIFFLRGMQEEWVLYTPGWTWVCNVAKDDLECPTSSPKYRDYRYTTSNLVCDPVEMGLVHARQALWERSHIPSSSMSKC